MVRHYNRALVKVWGQMGVTIRALVAGCTMGPPADKE